MIYEGDTFHNFAGSMFSADKNMTKDVLFSELHRLIDTEPEVVAKTLKNSGVYVPNKPNKKKLIHLTVENLYENKAFRSNISNVIGSKMGSSDINYSNIIGDGATRSANVNKVAVDSGKLKVGGSTATQGVGKVIGGGASSGVIGAVSGAVDSIFGFAKSKTEAKTQKEADKQRLIQSLIQNKQGKTNWLPIVLISSVLLIGGIIAIVELRKK